MMKKNYLKFSLVNTALLLAMFGLLVMTSCKKDDPDPEPDNSHEDWKGDITEATTLDASTVYKLTGLIKVKEGASLTIPAGTRIEALGGTSAAIIVEQGAQIFVNGTKNMPVIMTSGLANPSRGDWGGVVIAGRATCNSGGGMTEVGDVPYGGNIDDDNSGVIRYLRIEWSGAAFSSEKEYNGLSFFGVGNGTVVEYVQIHECADDPIEFYGGTVHANYIVSSNGEDDMFDWTEGWTGGGQYWYGLNNKGFGNRGFECDNWSQDFGATPIANPTIKNVTLIGSGDQGPEPQALMLRAGTAGSIDNIVVKDWRTGIEVRSDESIDNITNGTLKVTNIKFVDISGDILVVKNTAGETVTTEAHHAIYTQNDAATGAGAGADVPEWAKGWTIGLEDDVSYQDWSGDITGTTTLDATKVYKLTSLIKVKDGASLTIPAGTRIEAMGGTSAAIIVEQGGKIFVNGTKDNPVVMTSGLANPSRGDWGGVVIAGRATCNSGTGMTEVGDVPYGGNIDDDNSGIIRYLRIEWSGAAFSSEKEYNGLSFFGVGNGTVVEYVQIHECADDPIEFYGGTVHANYIVSSNGEDDMFDWTEGWTGGGQYWYGLNDKGFGNRGFECDNWSQDFGATPIANPTIKNVTLIGSGDQGPEPQALMLRAGTAGSIDNIVVKNWKTGIEVRSDESINNIFDGTLKVTNIKFVDIAGDILVVKNTAGETITHTDHEAIFSENDAATGAGAGADVPDWAKGWTVGLD